MAVLEHLQRTRAHTSFTAASSTDVVAGKHLVQLVERVIMKLDEALLEARLARDAMLLYIQVGGQQWVVVVCSYLTISLLSTVHQRLYLRRCCEREHHHSAGSKARHCAQVFLLSVLLSKYTF